jgi:hypothetical protein
VTPSTYSNLDPCVFCPGTMYLLLCPNPRQPDTIGRDTRQDEQDNYYNDRNGIADSDRNGLMPHLLARHHQNRQFGDE